MTRDMDRDSNSDQTPLGPILRAPGVGPTLDVLGVPHIYKAKANDTGQQFSVWKSIVPPGAGTPAPRPSTPPTNAPDRGPRSTPLPLSLRSMAS